MAAQAVRRDLWLVANTADVHNFVFLYVLSQNVGIQSLSIANLALHEVLGCGKTVRGQMPVCRRLLTEQLIANGTLEEDVLTTALLVLLPQAPEVFHAIFVRMVQINVAPQGTGSAVGPLAQAADVPAGTVAFQVVPKVGLEACPEITLITRVKILGMIAIVSVEGADINRGEVTIRAGESFVGEVLGAVPSAHNKTMEQNLTLSAHVHFGAFLTLTPFRINLVDDSVDNTQVDLGNPLSQPFLLLSI